MKSRVLWLVLHKDGNFLYAHKALAEHAVEILNLMKMDASYEDVTEDDPRVQEIRNESKDGVQRADDGKDSRK